MNDKMDVEAIGMNAVGAFLAVLGAAIACADELPPEERSSEETLALLRELLQEGMMHSPDLSRGEQMQVLALSSLLHQSVRTHSDAS